MENNTLKPLFLTFEECRIAGEKKGYDSYGTKVLSGKTYYYYTMRNDFNEKNLNGWSLGINVFRWILKNIPRDSTVLEFGSGNGSLELSRFYNVYSVEQNEAWVNKHQGVNYIYAPIQEKSRFYDVSFLPALPDSYDLLILDGPTGYDRDGIFPYLDDLNTNVPIIVDDTQRQKEATFALKLAAYLDKKVLYISETDKSSVILLEKYLKL